jgi:DNA polymerase-3 subunit alpha
MVILIRSGALRFTGKSKKELLWETQMLIGEIKTSRVNDELFVTESRTFSLPPLEQSTLEDAYDEIELLGFPVTLSSFDLLQTKFRGEIMAKQLSNYVGKKVRMVGNLAALKDVVTIRKEWMNFGAFIDAEGEFFDTVNFPDSLKKYPFKGYGVYLILGKVVEDFGFPTVEVEKMQKLPVRPDPRY